MTRPTEASVIPIRLTLDERSGVTLWATPWIEDDEEWQAFLGSGRRVLVFPDPAAMADYLRSGQDNDLTDHPRWPALRRLPADQLEPADGYEYDLDGAYDLAAAEPDPFVISELSDLLDIVQRIAECCDDGTLLRLLEETPEFAGLLADDVSYSGPDGQDRWNALGAALDRSWELVAGRLEDLLEWRAPEGGDAQPPAGAADEDLAAAPTTDRAASGGSSTADLGDATGTAAVDPAQATGSARLGAAQVTGVDGPEPDGVGEDGADQGPGRARASSPGRPTGSAAGSGSGAATIDDSDGAGQPGEGGTIWDEAGILPIEVTSPAGTGFTLRTYIDDEPRFLGADLSIDIFRSAAGLLAFIQAGSDHDLTDLETWPLIGESEGIEVHVATEDVYDLTVPSEASVELALDIAEFCQLAGAADALASRHTGAVPFDTWAAVVAELDTCMDWHD